MYKDYPLINKEGDEMVIRVADNTPDIGVLLLVQRIETRGPFWQTPEHAFPIVSLRQPPELCGVDESKFDQAKKEEWIQSYRDSFARSLAASVTASGISTLRIAGGGIPWEESPYVPYLPITVVEEVWKNI